MTDSIGILAGVYLALYVAHDLGDHWFQTHRQAIHKAAPGWGGRLADARHVATLTALKVAARLGLTTLGLHLSPGWVALALGVDATSHLWADRRTTLAALCTRLGRGGLLSLDVVRSAGSDRYGPGTGAYILDQSWHRLWLVVAAALVVAGA